MKNSFLQSSAWAAFNKEMGAPVVEQNDLVYIGRTFRFGKYWLSSRCHIPNGYSLPSLDPATCFIRFEPETEDSLTILKYLAKTQNVALLPAQAVQPRQTLVLDISADNEALLAAMKPKHRYNLRLAERNNLQSEIFSEFDEKALQRFWKLLSATATRQGFRTHTLEYYRTMFKVLSKDGLAHILIISGEQGDLAASLLITYQGTATYLHGASSEEHKQLMAPYLMHWKAIELGKSKDCSIYDFWGTDLEKNEETGAWEPKQGHPSAGTSRFKIGFGGSVIEYPGPYDLILRPFCYTLYKTARRVRGGKRAFN